MDTSTLMEGKRVESETIVSKQLSILKLIVDAFCFSLFPTDEKCTVPSNSCQMSVVFSSHRISLSLAVSYSLDLFTASCLLTVFLSLSPLRVNEWMNNSFVTAKNSLMF